MRYPVRVGLRSFVLLVYLCIGLPSVYAAYDVTTTHSQITWDHHHKLSWDDFKGAIPPDAVDNMAAATYCGIGIDAAQVEPGKTPVVNVYNTFYITRSWVRPDAHNSEILEHEQGHFDLCELYTRKLKKQLQGILLQGADFKLVLKNLYEQVNAEYEIPQQVYEAQTSHGMNIREQKKWDNRIATELAAI
ncbi:MAG: hypothetical protein H0X33_13760 [Taibaiella sp.]|nr:hypothetical protein [Taibaiella sp.]